MKFLRTSSASWQAIPALIAILIIGSCKGPEENNLGTPNPPLSPNPQPEPRTVDSTAVEFYGNLKVLGNKIVDRNDAPVQLRGMSFFWSQWIGKYYTPQTVKWLKTDWRCTIVRAAMAIEEGGYLTNPNAEKQKVFTVIDAAIA